MGYLFEELVRKFNEQANEEAGDHFTPREVIRLMVNLVFCEEQEIFQQGIYRTVYDPTAGTGGMLSVAEEYIKRQNPDANLGLFGQEYNPEAYAICCSDLLIKDEPIDQIIYGDTLGVKNAKAKSNNYLPQDGHPDKQFHYMFSNPPFGVEWKPEEDFIKDVLALDNEITSLIEKDVENQFYDWKVKKIVLDNFKSHGERYELDLTDKNGIIQIYGENQVGKCVHPETKINIRFNEEEIINKLGYLPDFLN